MNWAITNWKTSVTGLLTALFAFIAFKPEHFQQWPVLVSLSEFALVGGLATLGIMAKDPPTSKHVQGQEHYPYNQKPGPPNQAFRP